MTNVESAELSDCVFIEIIDVDNIKIHCNWCTGSTETVFFKGRDYDAGSHGNDWIAEAATHMATVHPSGRGGLL